MVRHTNSHKFLIPSADEILGEDVTGHKAHDGAGMTKKIHIHAPL